MVIKKSQGVTKTEKLLADLCDQTFLQLWSYPNPFNENKDELCDLLAVFDNHIFIFFDRENRILHNKDKDPLINWKRWEKNVITSQINTANGAERYILKNRKIFLDQSLQTPFPIKFDPKSVIIHKIIIAHGAKEACKNFSNDNVYGSLAVSYRDKTKDRISDFFFPFFVELDRKNPVHVFDSHNLQIIFSELDTFYDFSAYIIAKEDAIRKYDILSYCGEEDLLAHYFMNFDNSTNCHYIGTLDENFNGIYIGEGEWHSFIQRQEYKEKKEADKISYLWDDIIQKTCKFTLEGTILGDHSPLDGRSAIHEMAKEPRFHRRTLSEVIAQAIKTFPESSDRLVRKTSFMPSFYEGKGYVFLQLKAIGFPESYDEYRKKRSSILQIALGAAKNKFSHLHTIVGIAIDSPKYAGKYNSEDFILFDCSEWTVEDQRYYEKLNKDWQFFNAENISMCMKSVSEFPTPNPGRLKKKVGRNDPCPCGSGKKYKKCCIGIPINRS